MKKHILCRIGMHDWKKVLKAYGWTWFFGTQWEDTGRRICKRCQKEIKVRVSYAMMEGDIGN